MAALRAEGVFTPNEFTYWAAPGAPPPPPPSLFRPGGDFPYFYDKTPSPPPPVGVKWWRYAPGVPPLPPPPPGYDWRRDDANAPSSYDLSDLDRMTVREGGGGGVEEGGGRPLKRTCARQVVNVRPGP